MSIVLAAIDDTPAAASVLHSARVMASTIGAELRAIHAEEGGSSVALAVSARANVPLRLLAGDPAEAIVAASADPVVAIVVVGARARPGGSHPAGHVTESIMVNTDKPLLVVPPEAFAPSTGRIRRVLAPLDGSAEASAAVVNALRQLADAGGVIVALHVFGPATLPRFWDHAGHAEQIWSSEFLARCGIVPEASVYLRTGDVAVATLDVAVDESVDLIVLGWSRNLSGEHARVVREILGRTEVPVLLTSTM